MKRFLQELRVYGIVISEAINNKYLEIISMISVILAITLFIGGEFIRSDIFLAITVIVGAMQYTKESITELINKRNTK